MLLRSFIDIALMLSHARAGREAALSAEMVGHGRLIECHGQAVAVRGAKRGGAFGKWSAVERVRRGWMGTVASLMKHLRSADVPNSTGELARFEGSCIAGHGASTSLRHGVHDRVPSMGKAASRDLVIAVVRRIEPPATPLGRYREPGFTLLDSRTQPWLA